MTVFALEGQETQGKEKEVLSKKFIVEKEKIAEENFVVKKNKIARS